MDPQNKWGKLRPPYLIDYPEMPKAGLGDGSVTPASLLFKKEKLKAV